MDFNDSPDEAQFRREARAFLEREATEYREPPPRDLTEDQRVHAAKSWQGIKARNGFAAILWPKELGGRGGTPMQQAIFNEEEARYHTPKSSLTLIGIGMAIPTLVVHGTPEQLSAYAPPTADGRMTWCQLFSEPSAGTDLGALRTRAERDGDGWVINGQKVWNSWAHRADIAILVARTDSGVAKHKGLTYFILDMKTPGVKAVPIRKMSGGAEFNQVFLTDVRIPDSMRVGAVGDGWKVAMTTLMNERFGTGGGSGNLPKVQDLLALTQRRGRADDPGLKQTLARLYAEQQGMKYTRYRSLTQLSRGRTPGQEGAILKLSLARHLQELTALAIDIDNEAGMLGADENPELADYQYNYLHSIALRIAGGTDEVLRTQIGERMLGMPAEARVDKNLPFKDLPV